MIERIERYCDEVPRLAAEAIRHGPFTIFVSRAPWPYYARPRLGAGGAIAAADVTAVAARQRQLGQPVAIEWIADVTPSLAAAAAQAGLRVRSHPLLVLEGDAVAAEAPPGIAARLLDPADADLARVQAALELAFGEPGTAVGSAGAQERDEAAGRVAALDQRRAAIASGAVAIVVAADRDGPQAAGSAVPRGDVAELAGIGTLPAARRRGLGRLVTATLVAVARERGARTIFLTAADDTVARVYERCGFRRFATAGIAVAA